MSCLFSSLKLYKKCSPGAGALGDVLSPVAHAVDLKSSNLGHIDIAYPEAPPKDLHAVRMRYLIVEESGLAGLLSQESSLASDVVSVIIISCWYQTNHSFIFILER